MKLKYLVGIGMACSMICSCSEEYMSFEGTDRIQFKTKTEEVYTFAYYPESIQKDTLQIELISVGEVTDYPRVIRFEQVTKEWKYTYDEEEPEKVVDSTYVDMEFPAVAGVHYESLGEKKRVDSAGESECVEVECDYKTGRYRFAEKCPEIGIAVITV